MRTRVTVDCLLPIYSASVQSVCDKSHSPAKSLLNTKGFKMQLSLKSIPTPPSYGSILYEC